MLCHNRNSSVLRIRCGPRQSRVFQCGNTRVYLIYLKYECECLSFLGIAGKYSIINAKLCFLNRSCYGFLCLLIFCFIRLSPSALVVLACNVLSLAQAQVAADGPCHLAHRRRQQRRARTGQRRPAPVGGHRQRRGLPRPAKPQSAPGAARPAQYRVPQQPGAAGRGRRPLSRGTATWASRFAAWAATASLVTVDGIRMRAASRSAMFDREYLTLETFIELVRGSLSPIRWRRHGGGGELCAHDPSDFLKAADSSSKAMGRRIAAAWSPRKTTAPA